MTTHHHPSLAEVLEKRCSAEWVELRIKSITLVNWIDPENAPEDRSNPSVSLVADGCASEYGTYSFGNVVVDPVKKNRAALRDLDEQFPLGAVNYYDEEGAHFSIAIDEDHYHQLIDATLRNPNGLHFRVAIPIWDNPDAKCLPLVGCQVFYTSSAGEPTDD